MANGVRRAVKDSDLIYSGGMLRGATFSSCRIWRYSLVRVWNMLPSDAGMCAFIGLNPSTADEIADDPTIRRCIGFARRWGFDGIYMLNAYGYRATDPRVMQAAADPVGADNDRVICKIADQCKLIVAAWGVHCQPEREAEVCRAIDRTVHCLGMTKGGRPKHPLYLPSDSELVVFFEPGI